MKPLHKATLWILMAFCAGTLLGASVSYLYFEEYHEDKAKPNRSGRSDDKKEDRPSREERILSWLEKRLSLDETQKVTIWKILEESRDKYRTIDKQAHEESSKVREETRQKILTVLSPEQVEEFNKILRERKRPQPKQEPNE